MTKVFVITGVGQKLRKSDFHWAIDGELAMIAFTCDGNDSIDGGCGCQRSMSGFTSRRGSTTFTVLDMPITEAQYIERFLDSMRGSGFLRSDNEHDVKLYTDDAKLHLEQAAKFNVGAVMERRGNRLQSRASPQNKKYGIAIKTDLLEGLIGKALAEWNNPTKEKIEAIPA